MNVAIRSTSFGLESSVISRVGADHLGDELMNFLQKKQVDTSLLQKDNKYPTGQVDVLIDDKGIATYDIKYPSAWDSIELTDAAIEKVSNADAFVFGSLACRDHTSRQTLLSLRKCARFKVFDVNLRPGFFDLPLIENLMKHSDLVKLNDEELLTLSNHFGSNSHSLLENINFLHKRFQIASICVTRGEKGAVLFRNNICYTNNGLSVKVEDTVGAGDSFLSALIYQLLTQNNDQRALDFACAVGTIVATKTGANPEISLHEIDEVTKRFNLLR